MLRPSSRGRRPCALRVTALAVLLFALSLVAAPVGAEAAPQLPTQGLYDNCAPEKSPDGCASRLRSLSRAGFKVVQNMGTATSVANLGIMTSYANTAQAYGVQVIWNVRPGLSDEDLSTVVAALRGHPSTWGYYISDEPTAADHDTLAAFAAKVKNLDPTHQRLIMGCGNCLGGEGSVSFVSDIDATLGTDIYPVWEQGADQPIVAKKVEAAAAGLRKVADRAGRQTVMALQSFRWGDSHYDSEATGIGQASRFPTRHEIEDQRNAAIAGGHPDLILWFTLNQTIGWEPGQRPWWWQEPSDPGTRWANLVGGAFAPLPQEANKLPVARFSLRSRPVAGAARAGTRRGMKRVRVDAGLSYDPDGRIVRYRWYVSGKSRAVCARRRCSLKLRRGGRREVKLMVTDDHGARSARVRRFTVR